MRSPIVHLTGKRPPSTTGATSSTTTRARPSEGSRTSPSVQCECHFPRKAMEVRFSTMFRRSGRVLSTASEGSEPLQSSRQSPDNLTHGYSGDERPATSAQFNRGLGTAEQNIEKGIRGCWTLDALYNKLDVGGPRLLLAASLSKCYGLIERFSEDIDITVFREDIGQAATRGGSRSSKRKKRNAPPVWTPSKLPARTTFTARC